MLAWGSVEDQAIGDGQVSAETYLRTLVRCRAKLCGHGWVTTAMRCSYCGGTGYSKEGRELVNALASDRTDREVLGTLHLEPWIFAARKLKESMDD